MRLNGIVEINETEKLNVPIGAVFKVNLAVPHIHQGADNPLSFTVGLRTIDTGKLLTDTVLPASFDESVAVSSFKFRTVIGISAVDLIRTLGNDSVYEKASCAEFYREEYRQAPWRNHRWPQTDICEVHWRIAPSTRKAAWYRSEQARLGKTCYSAWSKFLESRAFQYIINRWPTDMEAFRQMRYLPQPGLI